MVKQSQAEQIATHQSSTSIHQTKAAMQLGPKPNPSIDASSLIGLDGHHYNLKGHVVTMPNSVGDAHQSQSNHRQ